MKAMRLVVNMFLFCLVCGLTSQSTAMVMWGRSVNLTALFLGKLRLSSLPVLSAHTFASKLVSDNTPS